MDDHDVTYFEAIEPETRRCRLSVSRTASRRRARPADQRKRALTSVCLAGHCKSLCGENVRRLGPVGSGGARPLRAPGCAFHRPCLDVPALAL
jgi:hypothetical protein